MVKELSPAKIKEIIESGEKIRLVDVREEWEYNIARIENAELMPLSQLAEYSKQLGRDEKIIVYCHHGVRSLRACYYLLSHGFSNVINLKGGIDAWAYEVDASVPTY